ncbi:hypothetical protein GQ44DRAFT_798189 [Phaeosphaeriaceae sp. PMI808]|nr:hypothetical protein GQ44DRAFT_798189 [Phaeosphaeriaceae sp. PMI808]
MAPNTDAYTRTLVITLKSPPVGKSILQTSKPTGAHPRTADRTYGRATTSVASGRNGPPTQSNATRRRDIQPNQLRPSHSGPSETGPGLDGTPLDCVAPDRTDDPFHPLATLLSRLGPASVSVGR